MKRIILMLLALLPMFAIAQNAQPKKTVDERVQDQTERMAKDLNLSEEQKAKVATINEKYLEEAKVRKDEAKAEKQARLEEAKNRADARDAELKAVLTEEQYAKHLEMKASKQEKRREKIEKWKQKRGKGAPKE